MARINILNFGAGINSTSLLLMGYNYDYILFSDTGAELPETYKHLEYVLAKNYKITIFKSKYGNIYDYYYNSKKIPLRKFRDCTDKFKTREIYRYIKQFKKEGINQYIGISWEEMHRARPSEKKYINNIHPLVDNKINRNGCIEIIKKANFNMPVKSGCYFCPFQSAKSWAALYNNYHDLFEKAKRLEENNRNYPKITLMYEGTLRDLEKAIKSQTKLSDYSNKLCGGHCFL